MCKGLKKWQTFVAFAKKKKKGGGKAMIHASLPP